MYRKEWINMKLSEINTKNITDDIIKKVLFSIQRSNFKDADCLIIFGCHIKPLLDERLKHAIEVLKANDINTILLTGGVGVSGDFDESKYMKEVLLSFGISKNKIIIENKSTTTEENVVNCVDILRKHSLIENKKIVILSNQAHLRRIDMEIRKQLGKINYELFYEYPEISQISYNNMVNSYELRNLAISQVKKIVSFIGQGIIDDEEI